MAIYSCNHRPVGKTTQAQPGTAGAHVHYITRDGAARLVMGEHMPTDRQQARAWMDEREAADRKNGRVCDKLMLALPIEMDGQQRADLVREFMQEIGGGRVSWLAAVHDRGEDAHNPHAHIILRDKDHEKGGRVFGTSEKGSTERLREIWETVANRALEREGIEARIDRRSLGEQGLAREAGIHVGPNVQAMEERGLRPESMAQDHTTSRGNDRVVNWPEIDQGRTRADRQREIEAMNRERDDERGRKKGEQIAELVPAVEPAQLHQLMPAAIDIEAERGRLAAIAEQALQGMERTLSVAAILRGLDDQARDVSSLIVRQEPQREALAQARDSAGMDVAGHVPQAIQRPSYEVAITEPEREPVEIRFERSRLAQIITAGREKLAALAGRLEQAFQMVRQRHEDREPIRVPDPPKLDQPEKLRRDPTPERPSAAAERDPWDVLNEPTTERRPSEPEREKEDWGRSLWSDHSRGRERKGPGF